MTRTTFLRMGLALLMAGALALAGCGGDDNGGLSAEEMARLAALEDAAAMAQETADAAVEAAMMDDEPMMEPEPEVYDPTDPGGTTEGAVGRAAANRIYQAVNRPAGARWTTPTSLRNGPTIASLSQTDSLAVSLTGMSDLSSMTDMAMDNAPPISGWNSVALEGRVGSAMQSAVVYSDAKRSVRNFTDAYPYNRDENGGGSGTDVTSNVVLTHRFIVDPPEMATDGDLTMIAEGKIGFNHELTTTGDVDTRMFGRSGDAANAATTYTTVRGTYDNVPGQYSCVTGTGATGTAAMCTITIDAQGVAWLSAPNNIVLLFKADDPDTLIPDRDYLAFGVWTLVPDNPTQGNPGMTRPFVKANAPAFRANEIDDLQGTASYSGNAVGHWATREAGMHTVDYGMFTADLSITANFDTQSASRPVAVPVEGGEFSVQLGTDTGVVFAESTVSNFMDVDSGDMLEGWLVNLNGPGHVNNSVVMPDATYATTDLALAASVVYGTQMSGTTDGSTGTTTGSLSWAGVWDGSFHGTNRATTPTGIIGTFHADAGTPTPVLTPEARINLFEDLGFAGVVGSFAGRQP